MSADFVRYSPEVEAFDPKLSEYMTRIIDQGDALAFNQWRVTSDHRPLGEIMDVRRVYTTSAKVRRTLNHQPQREPASADEVLAWPKLDGQPETARGSD